MLEKFQLFVEMVGFLSCIIDLHVVSTEFTKKCIVKSIQQFVKKDSEKCLVKSPTKVPTFSQTVSVVLNRGTRDLK